MYGTAQELKKDLRAFRAIIIIIISLQQMNEPKTLYKKKTHFLQDVTYRLCHSWMADPWSRDLPRSLEQTQTHRAVAPHPADGLSLSQAKPDPAVG